HRGRYGKRQRRTVMGLHHAKAYPVCTGISTGCATTDHHHGDKAMEALDQAPGPAEIYDARFVPALFAQWGPVIATEAGTRKGDRVLDVACGTGALALAAAAIVGPSGS